MPFSLRHAEQTAFHVCYVDLFLTHSKHLPEKLLIHYTGNKVKLQQETGGPQAEGERMALE